MDLINITGCDAAMESTGMVAVSSVATAIGSEPDWSAAGSSRLSSAAAIIATFATASSAFA